MYTIRKTTDYKKMAEINEAIFGQGFELYWNRHECWLVYCDGDAVGICSYKSLDKNIMYLSRAGVLYGHRGHGLQRRMINTRIAHGKKARHNQVITYTTKDNAPSFNSLQKQGFRLYIPAYQWAGDDMLYWIKSI